MSKPIFKIDNASSYVDIKFLNSNIKKSFGLATLSTNGDTYGVKAGSVSELSRRMVPKHLRVKKINNSPGPGRYEHSSSMQILPRHSESKQDSTWQRVRGSIGIVGEVPYRNPAGTFPKKIPGPGPGEYSIDNLEIISNMNKP